MFRSATMYTNTFSFFIYITNTLLIAFPIALEACIPPPAVECHHGFGCTIFNYQGIWEDRSICRAAKAVSPTTEAQLVNAVADAVKNKQKIKVVSRFAHSLPKLVCVGKEGVIISTRNYGSVISVNKSAITITVESGAMMRDVIDEAAKEGLALPAMIYWDGVSAGGVISTGAHGSGVVGRGSAVHEYVVGLRIVVPAPASLGYAKVITLTEADPELKAARLSLGTLGAISQITFALQPMFKRSLSFSLENDVHLEDHVEGFLRAHEFGDIYWFPAHRKALFGEVDRVSAEVPGNGLNRISFQPTKVIEVEEADTVSNRIEAKEDAELLCNITGDVIISRAVNGNGFLNDGNHFTGYPVVGFNNRMQSAGGCQDYYHKQEYNILSCTPTSIVDKNQSICLWDRRVTVGMFAFDVEIRVPLSRIGEAIVDVKKLTDMNPRSMCEVERSGIVMRSIKKSEAYLGPAEDVVTFELIYARPRLPNRPKWNEDVYEEIEQMLIEKHGGTLHWGKSGGFLFEGLAKRAVNLKEFVGVKERFDIDGIFSNEWTDGLLGIGGRGVEELREGCALDKKCKCREDKHCAPAQGYLCKQGRVWKNARVCRKED